MMMMMFGDDVHLHFLDAILVDFLQVLHAADEDGGHQVAQCLKDIPATIS